MLRELGPAVTGLMLSGRVGAAMAAEIGTMKVTEQIDALVTLATNPVKYLVVPRVVAATTIATSHALAGANGSAERTSSPSTPGTRPSALSSTTST